MDTFQCPACGTVNSFDAETCQSCQEDLTRIRSVIDTANRHYNEALALSLSGRLDEAIGQVEAALALNAHNPNYHILLGTLYAQKEDYEKAIRTWEQCIATHPELHNAYKNIEKANAIIDEMDEERQKRPFLLTAIGAGALSVILFVSTGFFFVQSYFKSSTINNLTQLISDKDTEIASLRQQNATLTQKLPEQGILGLQEELKKAKGIIEQQDQSIQQYQNRIKQMAEKQRTDLAAKDNQINQLNQQLVEARKQLGQTSSLQAFITRKDAQIRALEKEIETYKANQQKALEEIDGLKKKLAASEKTVVELKLSHEREVAEVRNSLNKTIEEFRAQNQDLRNELAQKEVLFTDLRYANNLVIEALKDLEINEYSSALNRVDKALQRYPDHAMALFVQTNIQRILADPIEMEIRRKTLLEKETERKLIMNQLPELAKRYLDNGELNRAIDTATYALTVFPANSKQANLCREIINQANRQLNP